MTGATITDPTSGLRMVGRNVIELFSNDYPRDYPEPESVVAILRRHMKVDRNPSCNERKRRRSVIDFSKKVSILYDKSYSGDIN